MDPVESSSWTKVVYLVFGIVFLTSGLLINLMQFALHISLKRFNKNWFRKINYYLNYSLFSQTVFALQYWANAKVKLYAKKNEFETFYGKENVLLIMNHTYEIDWLIGWVLCENCHVLGNCKTFAKKSIQYIPTLGFAWKFGESIFLERVWDKDRTVVERKLEELTTYEEVFWLLLTAEGTRFTEEKHKVSKAYAKEHGLPELRHHLTPRTKGFTTAIPHLRKKVPAIYSINIGVRPSEVKPTFRNVLLGKSISAGMLVERIPMTEVPEDEEKQAAWLHDLYKKKDDLLHSYLETGNWYQSSQFENLDEFYLPKRIFPLLNFAFWCSAVLITLANFLVNLLISGSWIYFTMALAVLGSLHVAFGKIIGETKISQASSYGVNSAERSESKN